MRGMPQRKHFLSQACSLEIPRAWAAFVCAAALILSLEALQGARAAEECLSCHAPESGLTNSKGKDITVKESQLRASVHSSLGCVVCHAGAAKFPHTAKTAAAKCSSCHGEIPTELAGGAHAM